MCDFSPPCRSMCVCVCVCVSVVGGDGVMGGGVRVHRVHVKFYGQPHVFFNL